MNISIAFIHIFFIKSGSIFEMIQVIIISGIKFIVAIPISIGMGFNFIQTFMITTAGGLLGVIFFFYLGEGILILWKHNFFKIKGIFVKQNSVQLTRTAKQKKELKKSIFTWRNRFIVNVRRKWGLIGIAILTPVLLSIPLGTFLANRYYKKNKRNVLIYLSVSVTCWSLIMSFVYFFF